MKISIAQIEPIKGDIEKNLSKHLKFIEAASSGQSDLIMFPAANQLGQTSWFASIHQRLVLPSMLSAV